MKRIPEPELMLRPEQAAAYAAADFAEPHNLFIALLRDRHSKLPNQGKALDLGCGPGDIAQRFALAFPCWSVDGVDGSPAMIDRGRNLIREAGLDSRVQLLERCLPTNILPQASYDLLFSNSLLHHLTDAHVLWTSISQWSRHGTKVFVMDLLRPSNEDEAKSIVQEYAANEPEVLQTDFYNSLLAAYRVEEIEAQLQVAKLSQFHVEEVSDRHFIAWGSV